MGFWNQFGERPGFAAGALSFFLPGLGQLYQRRLPAAVVCFLAFAVPLVLKPGYPYPLFIAILSGAEAFARGQRSPTDAGSPARRTVYTACGALSFVFWAWLVSPAALPLQRQVIANARAEALARELLACAKGSTVSARVTDCRPSDPLRRDPWGHDWMVEWDGEGFTLHSTGPDRTPGTRDDLRYRYHVR